MSELRNHANAALTERGDSAEPSRTDPAGDGAICAACGQVNPVGASQCVRPTCRKTLKGNGLARMTGLHVTNHVPEFEAIEAAGRALLEQSVTDAGGRDELIARELAHHEYRALLHVRILKLAQALERHGQFDRRGRLRVGWITKLESLIGTALSIDKTLGLTRLAKPVADGSSEAALRRALQGD
jgi:hypothetical protein